MIDIQTNGESTAITLAMQFQCLNRLDRHSNCPWRDGCMSAVVCFNASIGLIDIQTCAGVAFPRRIAGFNASIGLIPTFKPDNGKLQTGFRHVSMPQSA